MNALQQEILRCHDAVRRGEAGARRKLERLQAAYRTSGSTIDRPGGSARLIESATVTPIKAATAPIAGVKTETAKETAKALAYGHPYSEVQLVERGYADFSVDLGSGARETILDAIRRTQREVGPELLHQPDRFPG